MENDKKQAKLKKLENLQRDPSFAMFKEMDSINDNLEDIKENTKPKEIQKVKLETGEQDDLATAFFSMLKGKKGDTGEKGDKGDKGEDGKDGLNGKDGTNGKDGVDGVDGKDGIDGRDGNDGKDGIDGKDGSPDTPNQIVDKLNSLEEVIDQKVIKGLTKKIADISQNIAYSTVTKEAKLYTGTSEARVRELIATTPGIGSGSSSTGVYRNLWVPSSAMTPRITNGALGATEEYATNDIMQEYYLFDSTTEEAVQFSINMPDDWDLGTIKYKVYWDASTGASAADTVSWGVKAGALSNDDAIDQALGSQVVVNDVVIAVGDLHISPASAALTIGGTPTLGDLCIFQVVRNVSGTDDMTEDAKLLGVSIQYLTNTTATTQW